MSRKKIVHRAILGIGMALLIIALLIMIILRSNIDAKYVKARNATGEALYNQLYMMCQTFDQVNVPDQEATAIPIMKNYFLSAKALNQVLSTGFGERYRLLSGDDVNTMEDIFDAYETAFRTGMSTDSAKASMQQRIDSIRATLAERFKDDVLKPA